MTQVNQNAKVYRGDSALFQVTLTTEDGGDYVYAPGDELNYRIARNAHSPENESLVMKSLGNGLTILDSVASIDLTTEDTDLEPGLYYHELKIIDPPTERSTAMTGTVIIKPSLRMAVPLQAAPFESGAPGL
jgi:hypothetical protein